MRSIFKCLVVILLLSSCSAGRRDGAELIEADVRNAVKVNVDTLDCMRYATDSPISVVEDVFINGRLMFFKAGNALYRIDMEENGSIATIGRQGRGPGEYVNLWNFCVTDENVFIYDIDSKDVLQYDSDGGYIRSFLLSASSDSHPFQSFFALEDGGWIGKRIYGMPHTPELSLYDASFEYVEDVDGEEIKSGIKLWRQFYQGADGNVLFNRFFSNEILSFRDDSLSVKYTVSFGDRTFNGLKNCADEYECIDKLNAVDGRYASLICNICETDRCFSFQFTFDAGRYHLIYDRKRHTSTVLKFVSDENEIQYTISDGKTVYVFAQNEAGELLLFSTVSAG